MGAARPTPGAKVEREPFTRVTHVAKIQILKEGLGWMYHSRRERTTLRCIGCVGQDPIGRDTRHRFVPRRRSLLQEVRFQGQLLPPVLDGDVEIDMDDDPKEIDGPSGLHRQRPQGLYRAVVPEGIVHPSSEHESNPGSSGLPEMVSDIKFHSVN